MVLAAAYLLYMFQRVFYGEINQAENRSLPDLKRSEIALAGVLVVFIFWGGLAPNTFLKPMEASVDATILMSERKAGQRPEWAEPDMEVVEEYRPRAKHDAIRVSDPKRTLVATGVSR